MIGKPLSPQMKSYLGSVVEAETIDHLLEYECHYCGDMFAANPENEEKEDIHVCAICVEDFFF